MTADEIDGLLQRALGHHQAGQLSEAEAAYRHILARKPAHADALHLLGVIALQVGRPEIALDYIGRAIALAPERPGYHGNLGAALAAAGRLSEAEASCREAVRLSPNDPEAHFNLGNLQRQRDSHAEAAASYREALRRRPAFPDALNNLAIVLTALDRPAEAEASCREALRLRPDFPAALANLGIALRDLGRPVEAEESYRHALRLQPDASDALNNLGALLIEQRRFAEAETAIRAALAARPGFAGALSNLGHLLHELDRLEDAEACLRAALRREPALADAHLNLAMTLLRSGRLAGGWEEYEWRWQTKEYAGTARRFAAPQWRGEAVAGRTILLHAEQGLGDTLQFCRYVPLVAARGATVVLEVQPALAQFLRQLDGKVRIVARGEALPPFDLQCPLLSLPRAFGTTLDSVPASTPYLCAEPGAAVAWRERLAGLDGLRVGLAWAGSAAAPMDRRRSIPLEQLAPLGEVPGASFVSLQKDRPDVVPPAGFTLHDMTVELADFGDTAALIDGLDLVISVDTAVAHLAGAMGKPVWLLNRFSGCWRWLRDRDDSPWYPTLRQFRQPSPGDWGSAIAAARDALQHLAAV